MDHVNIETVEFQSRKRCMWIDREWWTDKGKLEKSAAISLGFGEEFYLTEQNIYDIIAELHKTAAWLHGDE